MSRRKQSNPKPLNKGDCSDTTEEMMVDSRDSKDLNRNDMTDDLNRPSDSPSSPLCEADVELSSSSAKEHTSPTMQPKLEPPSGNMPDETNHPTSLAPNSPDSTRHHYELPESSRKPRSPQSENAQNVEKERQTTEQTATPTQLPEHTTTPSPPIHQLPNEEAAIISPSTILPKLRLNALLASDPALKPDAKDLKAVHEESQSKHRIAQLAGIAAQPKTDHLETMLNAQAGNLVESVLKPAPPVEAPPRMKVFMCLPCGIGFSSPSTLEAHQAYYCSHRHKDVDDESTSQGASVGEKTAAINASPTGATGAAGSAPSNAGNSSGEPAAKAIKTGKQYACTQCSYSADKKVSLNRHMRMHQTSPAPSSNTSNGGAPEESSSQQIDRYCSDCDIRFNNIKTYRAHKQHYCSSRRNDGQLTPKLEITTTSAVKVPSVSGAISPQTRTKTPTSAMVAAAAAAAAAAVSLQPPPQPFLALPTNPILIIPYSLIRAASLIPGPLTTASSGIVNPEMTCFTLDNGNLKPLASALNISAMNVNAAAANTAPPAAVNQIPVVDSTRQPQMPNHDQQSLLTEKNASRNQEANDGPPKRKEAAPRDSAPLDLSLRRSPISAILQRQRLRSASAFLDPEHHRLDMENLLEAGKENLVLDDSGSVTPEQIVCAPSLPNSPSMSPSPKRRAISPRSSGAGSTSSMSPPNNVSTASLAAAAAASNMLDNLPLRSMLPADIALKFSESNMMNPLLAKQNLELALKLSAAAAAAVSSSTACVTGTNPADMAAAVGKSSLLGLPVMPNATGSSATGTGASGQPQIYVKQGVSKCKECNIVFCKYENYLAHKQHYCSARNQDTSDGEPGHKVSSTPPISGGASTAETTPVAYQQLICAACGIKYTSLDNLRAHQNYYCPKGGGAAGAVPTASGGLSVAAPETVQLSLHKEKCTKCKTMHEIGLPCPPPPALQLQQPSQLLPGATTVSAAMAASGNQNVYKCPMCDAVSLTATESRKHMETHGTVKAFRCSICRYKGNTLRGMRTHIRMHFDKKTSDFNEEHYMSCILEEEGMEIPSASILSQEQLAQQIVAVQHQQHQLQQAAAAAVAAGLQQQSQQQQQVYNCEICNYSSCYKGNVLRHMKLVHLQVGSNSPSISPEAGDLDVSDAASLSSSLNGDNGANSFAIKSEPLDHANTISNSTGSTGGALGNFHDNNNSPIPIPVTGNTSNDLMTHIKSEPMDISIDTGPPTHRVTTPLPPLTSPAAAALNVSSEENSAAAAAAAAALNQKYCHTCDISFNYMKTFLAHKQFYCKNKIRRPEANESPSPNAALMQRVQSPNAILLQKNKENLQQEAAI